MANTAQAKKRARQNDSQRAHNASLRSIFRTAIKKITKVIEGGDKKAAIESTKKMLQSLIELQIKKLFIKIKRHDINQDSILLLNLFKFLNNALT